MFALYGDASVALLWIVIGAVFDFFDGMTARLLHVSSPIGKELDSLADDVTFGVAPSAILFSQLAVMDAPSMLQRPLPGTGLMWADLLPYLAFIMAAFSALRLAKFNLDERQAMGFIGLPTPANALFWGSLIVGLTEMMPDIATVSYFDQMSYSPLIVCIIAGIFISSNLLIAEIPMFALKFKTWGWKGNEIKFIFLLTCIPMLLLLGIVGLAAIIAWYVILSVISNRISK